ncbi:EAL domain-containing protein [Halomonas vilamensis]|uniref:EAL domain-containing protein n=1 Tax=Vreelandella vilamensis TaxID=531309 RepID=A0ABU1H2N1_9GAMM|nr:EAL domain-containing protein [Halomonas vilamensis]MDR5898561.1 EAL domain-containing protein [Halomonas vilamensis]
MSVPVPPIVVGVGASAGGLEAITQLIRPLDPELPIAYVVLQHVSPAHKSMLVDILSRETRLKVRRLTYPQTPEAGVIYVVPADTTTTIKKGVLHTASSKPHVMPNPSINDFFISLAADAKDAAVGVVLSGTGSDGTAGLREILAAGGVTFVQAPESAKYAGMPQSALDAGMGDYVLAPDDIAQRLTELVRVEQANLEESQTEVSQRLLELLKEHRQLDFSGYKPGTLNRRIRRRLVATQQVDMAEYLKLVESNSAELDLLARDILISVTAFFRDREAFEALEKTAHAIVKKADGNAIRVWVAGCATGEEAYSIAILLAEAKRQQESPSMVQIFATDIDDNALEVARRGHYVGPALETLSQALIKRYFTATDSGFEVGKTLRDMIVFAKHNLVSDPPFLRLDLVTCRNVLIYFDSELQAKVLQRFHFALLPHGVLFLGRSESISQADSLFTPLNRRERVFCKQGDSHEPAQQRQSPLSSTPQWIGHEQDEPPREPEPVAEQATHDIALDPLMEPPSLPEGASVEEELAATREHLQSLIKELAGANEEMQSLNEEAQAANEELQATNEEMEAANEELQASNEELISLNDEFSAKSAELSALNEEYIYLYDSLEFPLLVFDTDGCLKRYNASAAHYFNFRPTALNRPVSGLRLPEALGDLGAILSRVMSQGMPDEQTVKCDGRLLQRVVTPGVSRVGSVELLVVTLMDITDLSQTQAKLKQFEAQLHALMENTTIMLALKDLNGRYTFANPQFLKAFELQEEDLIGKNPFEVFPEEYAGSVWTRDLEALRYQQMVQAEHALIDEWGVQKIFATTHQVLRDAQGQPQLILTEAENITKRKIAEREMQVAAKVYEQAGEAIVVINSRGQVQSVNAAFSRITGFLANEVMDKPAAPFLYAEPHHSVQGNSFSDVHATDMGRLQRRDINRHSASLQTENANDPHSCDVIWSVVEQHGFWQGEVCNQRRDGELFSQWLTLNCIEPDRYDEQLYVAVFSDITHIKESQRHAEYLATHDALTDLPNRTLFQDRLQLAIANARRTQQVSALMFLDLDNFKTINDTLGHDVGDELLIQVAARLRELVRELDTVARLGGDEFTVILVDTTIEGAEQVAKRIVESLARPFEVRRHSLFVTASIGLAFCPVDSENAAGLTKAADTAMYRAKENGRDRFEVFKPELQERLMRDVAIEQGLREGMEHGRLTLVYQPKFASVNPSKLVGAEALLRWEDPELGKVSPADFIPVAEATGLILELDRYVALILIRQLADWIAQGLAPMPVAMNVSARSFQEERFVAHLFTLLKQYRVRHELIQVEITESTLVDRSSSALGNIEKLRDAGIKLAVDDFGTGYSSLAYLKRMPLAELKIDKSFVDGLGGDDESDQAISMAILGMAKALKIRTVGEGVETQAQLAWLARNGCDFVQGYLLSRPLTLDDYTQLISSRSGDSS